MFFLYRCFFCPTDNIWLADPRPAIVRFDSDITLILLLKKVNPFLSTKEGLVKKEWSWGGVMNPQT